VLLLHGLTSDKETMVKFFGRPLLQQGVAILALDAPLHGERKVAGQDPSVQQNFPKVVREGCLDYRTALDYLATRKDIDSKHIVLLGYSMGSMMGAILGGVDNRIGAFALCVGGDPILPIAAKLPAALRDKVYAICPSLYIGHIAPRPILMLNGLQDEVMLHDASDRLYTAANQPKQQLWYPTGHLLSQEAGKKAIEWLLAKVKTDAAVKTEK
jgi:predicted esterase